MKRWGFIVFLFCFVYGNSQTSFPWVETYNTSRISSVTTGFMLKTGEMLFAGCHIDPKPQADIPYMKSTPRLYTTTAGGVLVSSTQFVKLGNTYVQFISNVFEEADDSLVLIGDGLSDPDSVPTIVYAKCDYNLNVGAVKTFPIPLDSSERHSYCSSSRVGGSQWKRHPDGGYYGVMDVNGYRKNPGWQKWGPMYILYYRMDHAGTMLHYGKENPRYLYDRRSNVEYSPSLKQYVTTAIDEEAHWLDSSFTFIKFDTSKWWGHPDIFGEMELRGANTILPYKKNHLMVGGYYTSVSIPDFSSVHTVLLNDSFKAINRYNLRPPCVNCPDSVKRRNELTSRVTAEFQSFDYTNEDSIFFVCSESLQVINKPTYSVFMVDSNFTPQWGSTQTIENFAGIQSVKATPDGGCIVTGNTRINPNIYMFIQKFEKTGFPSGIRYFEDGMKELATYPNPGTGRIWVSGTSKGRIFTLYDLQGRAVLQGADATLTDGIDVSDLAPGVYAYTIRDTATGQTTSGKWVKQ